MMSSDVIERYSPVVGVSLYDNVGREIEVTDLSTPIVINIPITNTSLGESDFSTKFHRKSRNSIGNIDEKNLLKKDSSGLFILG